MPSPAHPEPVVGTAAGRSADPEPEPEPILGQFLFDVLEEEPVELLEGVVFVPVEFVDPPEPVAEVPLVPAEPVLVLDVVVAASAISAPPVIRPLVSAPTATTLRSRRIFMVIAPFVALCSPHLEEHHHRALRICGSVPTHIKPR
jgi:hypothetical protein